jgi:hypothetical protein
MSLFDARQRSWNAHLAGIGAGAALMASAFVMFVILVGVVTFKTWPHAGGLLGGGGGDVGLRDTATPAPARSADQPAGLDLVKLLGAQKPVVRDRAGEGGLNGRFPATGEEISPGGPAAPPGTSGGGQPQGAQQPPREVGPPSDVVGQTVSGLGNTVAKDTASLGDTLGGSTAPGLGGLVGGVGRTLNGGLQSLAGGR